MIALSTPNPLPDIDLLMTAVWMAALALAITLAMWGGCR